LGAEGRSARMKTIQNILFPVDFSPACEAMAPTVKRAASITSAKVTLLFVLEVSASGFQLIARSMREVEKDMKEIAAQKLESFLAADFPVKHSPRLLYEGEAAEQIVAVARERAIDLIAMPTHAGAFRRMLLGSTTAKVLNDADCPVLTTQHAETISSRPLEHREYLCAISLQDDSIRVLRYASQAAEALHSNLTLLHVIPTAGSDASIQLDLEEHLPSAESREARRRVDELQKEAGSHGRVSIVVGPMKESMVEAARRLRADVLVIGRLRAAKARMALHV
jgi:nucleotide-binding universal stress UspA family protein